jgi:hypothetical protein
LCAECNNLAAQSSSSSLLGSTANGIQFTLGEEQQRARLPHRRPAPGIMSVS